MCSKTQLKNFVVHRRVKNVKMYPDIQVASFVLIGLKVLGLFIFLCVTESYLLKLKCIKKKLFSADLDLLKFLYIGFL